MTSAIVKASVESQRKPTTRRLPFMSESSRGGINSTRLVEALVIAVFTSFVVYIMSVPKLEARLEAVDENLKEFKVQITFDVRDVKGEIKELRNDVYIPGSAMKPQSLQDQQAQHN